MIVRFAVAGGLATMILEILLAGSQGLRLSRLSLPLLLGAAFTADRRHAMTVGYLIYLVGGLVIASAYWLVFAVTGLAGWWAGALLGVLHALFLLVVVTPILPFVHPRVASEHDGPATAHGIEPPGFLALNYGYATPLVTIIAQASYGAILGALFPTQ